MDYRDSLIGETENNNEAEYSNDTVDIELPFLKNLAGWATFKAIIDIIAGTLFSLIIITAPLGIPMIISGIKLLGATDDLKRYIYSGDTRNIGDSLYNFNKYFKISGVSLIIRIVYIVIVIVLYILMLAYIRDNMPEIMDSLPGQFIPY